MTAPIRPYLFYDTAVSLCSTCFRRVDAKIVFENGHVYMLKRCPQHGFQRVMMADDVDYYRRCREVFLKPPEMPLHWNTPVKYGCPYDCGLCPDHEQHSCLSLLEITDVCNLNCPVCYAGSGTHRAGEPNAHRSLAQVERMLDMIVRNEMEPDIVQISGGEPTIHPQFFEILDAARQRPIKHLMVNTNGVRIATDEAFAERLATYMPRLELYLQFDSLHRDPLLQLRGADLRNVRQRALERLNALGISTTLVVTVERGVNDAELGAIVEFALQQPCVRGVTFQPVQQAGRLAGYNAAEHRLTLTEVRRRILEQRQVFKPEDIIPVPCHPDSLAMGYALKLGGRVTPLTGMIPPEVLINGAANTIIYEQDAGVRRHLAQHPGLLAKAAANPVKDRLFKLFSTNHSPQSQASTLRDLLCCLPQVVSPGDLSYQNLFRVLIVQFIDADSFDLRSIRKTCIHIAHPDAERLIPFDTYNLFYRDDLEQTRLVPLRERAVAAI
jgi:7,8-dihydro-6-hydroxymethylpterin dimethyltransferase